MRELSGASSLRRRRLAWRFGRYGETICAWRLRLAGYRIIARDVRTPAGEIDLVVRRRRVLAFIEVKSRKSDEATEALMPRQRRRIVRAAEVFLAGRPAWPGSMFALISCWSATAYCPDTFPPPSAPTINIRQG